MEGWQPQVTSFVSSHCDKMLFDLVLLAFMFDHWQRTALRIRLPLEKRKVAHNRSVLL